MVAPPVPRLAAGCKLLSAAAAVTKLLKAAAAFSHLRDGVVLGKLAATADHRQRLPFIIVIVMPTTRTATKMTSSRPALHCPAAAAAALQQRLGPCTSQELRQPRCSPLRVRMVQLHCGRHQRFTRGQTERATTFYWLSSLPRLHPLWPPLLRVHPQALVLVRGR